MRSSYKSSERWASMFVWCFHHDERGSISSMSYPSPLFTHEVNLCTYIGLLMDVKRWPLYTPLRPVTLVILIRVYQHQWAVAPRLELHRWWCPIAVHQSCAWLSWLRFCKICVRRRSWLLLRTNLWLGYLPLISNRSKDSLSIAVKVAHPSLSGDISY